MAPFQTEYKFTLPIGYADPDGTLHRNGVMRLATAADEILPLRDHRVQSNPAYLSVIVLSRVITQLGTLDMITSKVIEDLFAADFAFLQEFYNDINEGKEPAHTPEPVVKAFPTKYEFTLPVGYTDPDGTLHRNGVMRLATAADETLPLRDPRVQNNPAYLSVIILSRVITSLGTLDMITTRVIEEMTAADFTFLQDLYNKCNSKR